MSGVTIEVDDRSILSRRHRTDVGRGPEIVQYDSGNARTTRGEIQKKHRSDAEAYSGNRLFAIVGERSTPRFRLPQGPQVVRQGRVDCRQNIPGFTVDVRHANLDAIGIERRVDATDEIGPPHACAAPCGGELPPRIEDNIPETIRPDAHYLGPRHHPRAYPAIPDPVPADRDDRLADLPHPVGLICQAEARRRRQQYHRGDRGRES